MNKLKLLLIFCAFVFTACKKDSMQSKAPVSQNKINDLKNWYQLHKKIVSGLQSRDSDQYILPEQVPIWDSTEFHTVEKIYTTPLKDNDGSITTLTKALVIKVDVNGNILSGEFTFIKLTNAPDNLTLEQVLASYPKVFNFTDMPNNFKATMLKYNLSGELIYSKHFDNHIISEASEKIASIQKQIDPNVDCVYSWWVTWNPITLQILSILYLGSDCDEEPGGLSGGGGNGSTNPSNCNQSTWEAVLNSRTPLSEKESIILLNGGPSTRQMKYAWWFFEVGELLGSVKFKSTEIGTQHKVNGGDWEWSSLTHNTVSKKSGTLPNICWDATCGSVISSGIANNPVFPSWATMSLYYNISVSISGLGYTNNTTDDYESLCGWSVTESIVEP